jgi:hypothetical protein
VRPLGGLCRCRRAGKRWGTERTETARLLNRRGAKRAKRENSPKECNHEKTRRRQDLRRRKSDLYTKEDQDSEGKRADFWCSVRRPRLRVKAPSRCAPSFCSTPSPMPPRPNIAKLAVRSQKALCGERALPRRVGRPRRFAETGRIEQERERENRGAIREQWFAL